MALVRDKLFDISGQTFFIAGAGGGLAKGIVHALNERGAKLFLIDNNKNRLKLIGSEIPAAKTMMADITDEKSLAAVVAAIKNSWGQIDGGINAAGVLPISDAVSLDEEIFKNCLEVNVTGAFFFSRAAVEAMNGRSGRIIHLSSVSSFVANKGYAAYASSKAGLSQLVRVLAREWAAYGITVNAIGPALTETQLTKHYLKNVNFRRKVIELIPMGRLGTSDDIVAPILLLLAPGGAFITGQTIFIDGGRTLV